jgi:putative ABC transport system permease protein
MMPLGKLARVVVKNTVRSPRHFVLSAFGIVIGIASFVFFLGLSMGVRNVLLGKIFPLEEVSVVAPVASFGGFDLTKKLDDAVVQQIREHGGVKEVVPRMSVVFPTAVSGTFDGAAFNFAVGGFADGIDPGVITAEAEGGAGTLEQKIVDLFRDWETAEEGKRAACTPPPAKPCADFDRYYCDKRDNQCHHRVPVLASPTMLELYNAQFAKANGLPPISELESFMVQRGGLSRMRFTIGLGETVVAGTSVATDDDKTRTVEGVLVGVHPRAMGLGLTMPIEYVRRWNREFVGEDAALTYSSILVILDDKDQVAPFAAWVRESLGLRLEDSMGERFATAIFIVTMLFFLISLVIVSISAVNIAHNFFMQVSERRREIGVLRAVGATRTDVRLIVLGEAALIGVIGGVLGVSIALLGGFSADWVLANLAPDFPFKPTTLFDFRWWIIVGGLAFSTVFCVLGGYLPARRAARMEPAQALAAQ